MRVNIGLAAQNRHGFSSGRSHLDKVSIQGLCNLQRLGRRP
jgi:hypothetical protein